MLQYLIQWTRFILLIANQGSVRGKAYDYGHERALMRKEFPHLCPGEQKSSGRKTRNYLSGQAAFIKNSFSIKGGHLSAPGMKLAYIRNPKAGSTSLAYFILKALYSEIENYHLTADKINTLTDINLSTEFKLSEKLFTFFTVVRNPFARLVSVYRSFFEKASNRFIYDDYLFGILKKDMSFGEFVNKLEIIPDVLRDQHVKGQHRLLQYYRKKKIDVQVFKLESPDDVKTFLSHYGASLAIFNKDEHPYDYRLYYNADVIEKVYRIYADDIKCFGYEQEYLDLRSALRKPEVAR
jgi:hypothetical protein